MLWVKALHLIFMVTWFAGLFYLPRLFVYHASCTDPAGDLRFRIMERRLFVLMTIGGTLTAVFGLWMLFDYGWQAYRETAWLPLKLALVAGLIGYHVVCARWLRVFARGENRQSEKFYRVANEIPTLFLISIILLSVVKPF